MVIISWIIFICYLIALGIVLFDENISSKEDLNIKIFTLIMIALILIQSMYVIGGK